LEERNPVKVPAPVLEQIEAVYRARRCAPEDRRAVQRVADQLGHHAAAWWIGENPTDYVRGTIDGFEPVAPMRLTYAVSIRYPDGSERVIDRNLSREDARALSRELAVWRREYPDCKFVASPEYTRPEPEPSS
jgi:hypothetical protein